MVNTAKLALVVLLMMSGIVCADIALPPTHIGVTYNNSTISGNFTAAELACLNGSVANSISTSVRQYDPVKKCYWQESDQQSGGFCTDSVCSFYNFPPSNFKLVVFLFNRTFVTNEVNSGNYTFDYTAHLYANGTATLAKAHATPPHPPIIWSDLVYVLVALAATAAIEMFVSFLYLSFKKMKGISRTITTVGVANLISIPVLWIGFIYLFGLVGFIAGEIFVVLFEGWFVYHFNKKTIKLKDALIMSLIANVSSLVIGGLLLIIFFGFV